MQSTKNYQLVKQELTDEADITQISGNWDKIDEEIKRLSDEKFDKTGGTITGKVIANGGVSVKGGTSTDTITTTGNATIGGTMTVKGGTTVASLKSTGNVSAGSATVTGDATVNGKVISDNIRAKSGSNALQVGVNNPANVEELLGMIIQWVSGNPRISLTHNPDKAANDKQIPTTNWVKSLIATQSEYGLVRLASEEDVLNETPQNAVCTELIYDINEFRRKSKAYKVGEKVDCAFQYERFLECTKAGTTSANLLDTRNVTHGQKIIDGTVEWTVRTHARSINNAVADANGNISIRTGVTSVDGVVSDSNGNVPLNAMAYKKLSSIQSVKGSFLFDSLSGIATSEIPAAALNDDWVGVQFGMSNGSDKTQIVMQGYEWFYRTADQNLGQETWSDWERFDPRYTAQNYLKLDGTNTMTGTIKSSVANGTWVGAANGQTVINSTAVDGAFVPLWQYESTSGGSFVLGGYKDAFTVTYISNESKASNTNTHEWTLTLNEQGVLSVPSDLLITGKLRFREAGGRDAAYVQPSAVADQYDFVLAGANQATFICSGEGGYATEEMKAFRDSLRVGGEDIVLASDNNIVLAASCNSRDGAVVKKAVLQTNGLFTLPVHPAANSNDTTTPTTKWVNDRIANAFPSGTQLLFYQANAPTGWTKVTGIGNRAVKIVENTTGGTLAGSVNFSDVFKSVATSSVTVSGTVGAKNITIAQMAAHGHTGSYYNNSGMDTDNPKTYPARDGGRGSTLSLPIEGGNATHTHPFTGSSHSHTVNLSVKYINVIVCRKD